jgi:hypothetical protein
LLPKDFRPITTGEIQAERGKNLTHRQVYRIRQDLKLD